MPSGKPCLFITIITKATEVSNIAVGSCLCSHKYDNWDLIQFYHSAVYHAEWNLNHIEHPVYLILDLSFLHFLFDAYEISESEGKYTGIK